MRFERSNRHNLAAGIVPMALGLMLAGCASIPPSDVKGMLDQMTSSLSVPSNGKVLVMEPVTFAADSYGVIGSLHETDFGIKTTDLHLYSTQALRTDELLQKYLTHLGYQVQPVKTSAPRAERLQTSVKKVRLLLVGLQCLGAAEVRLDLVQADGQTISARGVAKDQAIIPPISADVRPQRWLDSHEELMNDIYNYLVLAACQQAFANLKLGQAVEEERP